MLEFKCKNIYTLKNTPQHICIAKSFCNKHGNIYSKATESVNYEHLNCVI